MGLSVSSPTKTSGPASSISACHSSSLGTCQSWRTSLSSKVTLYCVFWNTLFLSHAVTSILSQLLFHKNDESKAVFLVCFHVYQHQDLQYSQETWYPAALPTDKLGRCIGCNINSAEEKHRPHSRWNFILPSTKLHGRGGERWCHQGNCENSFGRQSSMCVVFSRFPGFCCQRTSAWPSRRGIPRPQHSPEEGWLTLSIHSCIHSSIHQFMHLFFHPAIHNPPTVSFH